MAVTMFHARVSDIKRKPTKVLERDLEVVRALHKIMKKLPGKRSVSSAIVEPMAYDPSLR